VTGEEECEIRGKWGVLGAVADIGHVLISLLPCSFVRNV